jgi:predicted phage tail protein
MTIIGAMGGGKGGGGSSRTPTTAKDSLDSRQYANVIDLISEGEIEGLADGFKSIFLNNTVLQNLDGTYNFQDVTIYTRNGTQDQAYIPLSGGVEDEKPVGLTVVKDVPQVRTITDVDVDSVRVTIAIPALQKINSKNGDTLGASVQLQIAVQYQSGGYTTKVDDTITGRTADEYRKDYLINLERPNPSDIVDIKITRITNDSTDSLLSNAFSWSSYTEIVDAKLTYPNSALVGLRVDAEQFSSIPQRSYLVKGIKVAIPSNATVDSATGALIYTGIWNGTFAAAAWTTDPAWILWDLLTSSRYGFGNHIQASQLDKWAFYSASSFSSALNTRAGGTTNDYNADTGRHGVPNGLGGYEPRFSCNTSIQTAEEAYKLVNDLLSVMRCQAFWSTGSLTIAQDAPSDPVYLFNQANVTPEGFSYSGSSLKVRPNVAVVSYLDLNLRDTAFEVVEDTDSIAKYGVIKSEISAFACTSRGQANRIGRWLLFSERYEKEVCTFASSLDAGQQVRPGQIILISDPVRAGSRRAGRIAAATTSTITVDDSASTDLSYEAGSSLSVILPDGSVEQHFVANIVGKVITLQATLSDAPNVNSIWILESPSLQATTWRVISINESDGINYGITAISHNESKYAYIEDGAPLEFRDSTNLNAIPAQPSELAVISVTQLGGETSPEVQYELNGRIAVKITFGWFGPQGVKNFRVKYRHEDDNFTTATVQGTTFDILDAKVGNYQIQVSSISSSGILFSEPALADYTVAGLGSPPSNVQNLSAIATGEDMLILTWKQAPELDVQVGGRVIIRHDPRAIAGADWNSSNDVVQAVAGSSTQKQVPLLPGTYFLKFEDFLGNRSVIATGVEVVLPEPESRITAKEWAEQDLATPFSGTKTNCAYDVGEAALLLTPNIYVAPDYWETIYCAGDCGAEYQFADTFDLGAAYDFRIRRYIVSRPVVFSTLFDAVSGDFDAQSGFFDGTVADQINVTTYVRTTLDNPSGSPTWGPWTEFTSGMIRGRGVQVKAIFTTETELIGVAIDELGAELELTRRVTTSTTTLTSSSSAVTSITYPNAFYKAVTVGDPYYTLLPSVGVTGLSLGSNVTTKITNLTRAGFDVEFLQGGSRQVVDFTYNAVGYGRAF